MTTIRRCDQEIEHLVFSQPGMWSAGMKPSIGSKVRNEKGVVGVVSKVSGSMIYTDTFNKRGWKRGLEVWETNTVPVAVVAFDSIYYASLLTTATMWYMAICLVSRPTTWHAFEVVVWSSPWIQHGLALASNETAKWFDAEAQFHGVCSTVRGRMLHPSACRLGMEESIVMGTLAINILIHWCPTLVKHLLVGLGTLCGGIVSMFKCHTAMNWHVLRSFF